MQQSAFTCFPHPVARQVPSHVTHRNTWSTSECRTSTGCFGTTLGTLVYWCYPEGTVRTAPTPGMRMEDRRASQGQEFQALLGHTRSASFRGVLIFGAKTKTKLRVPPNCDYSWCVARMTCAGGGVGRFLTKSSQNKMSPTLRAKLYASVCAQVRGWLGAATLGAGYIHAMRPAGDPIPPKDSI